MYRLSASFLLLHPPLHRQLNRSGLVAVGLECRGQPFRVPSSSFRCSLNFIGFVDLYFWVCFHHQSFDGCTHLVFNFTETCVGFVAAAARPVQPALCATCVHGELWEGIPRLLHLDRFNKFVVIPISAVLKVGRREKSTAEGFDT